MSQSTLPVSKVRKGHELPVEKLEVYLSQHLSHIRLPIDIKQFSFGQSNPTYLLTDASGARFVLRKKPSGKLLSKTAHAVEREYRILKALGDHTDVPVPRVFGLCLDVDIIGTPFYLMEFLQGRVITDPLMSNIPHSQRRQYWKAAVKVLVKLHNVDFNNIGLSDYGKSSGYYKRQLKSLLRVTTAQARARSPRTGESIGPLPYLSEILVWLDNNPCPDETTVIHGDFKLDNIIFHPTEPRVIGLLDWELSTLGNPRADLANLLQVYLIPYGGGSGDNKDGNEGLKLDRGLGGSVPDELGYPTSEEVLQWYCQLAGRHYPLEGWEAARVFGLFRNAVIYQGVAVRHLLGQAASPYAHIAASQIPVVMSKALQLARDKDAQEGKLRSNI